MDSDSVCFCFWLFLGFIVGLFVLGVLGDVVGDCDVNDVEEREDFKN